MNPLNGLSEYLDRIERRLRVLTVSRGAALTAGAALAFTVMGAVVANYYAFSPGSVLAARIVLFLALSAAIGAGLALPMMKLNRRRAAHQAEKKCPQFEQRLVTFAERAGQPDPFLELLAADTLDVARDAEPERIAARSRIVSFASAGAAALIALLWLGAYGPGFLGYGTSLLWGAIPHNEQPFYAIHVEPGNHTIRRKSDQAITARLLGFATRQVRVFARFQSSSKWEEALMRSQPGGSNFEFLFAGVPEPVDYYVEAAGVRSKQFRLNVVDLPEVKRIRVTYHYPAWTGLKDAVEDPGGDLRAVEGTEAELKIKTDKPLANAAVLLDDGTKIELRGDVARVPLQKDGVYHIATSEHGDMVRLSNDYFIEVQAATPPTVRVTRPGRDAKVNPIEEVTIAAEAQDDFGLRGLDVHYSVNGGPEKVVAFAGSAGKNARGSTTLYLENYKLVPGDIVSLYATAKDALSTSRSDMFFIEAQPFERNYTQAQAAGGEGGGEAPSSQRQKSIIAATWNQIKSGSKDKAAEAENARLLADIQAKLRDQAKSLARRMESRALTGTGPMFQQFAQEMGQAIESMGQAEQKLRAREWQPALPPEQQALQHLSRAESIFRDIQVAFGNGGGEGGGAGRDLEGLFDLELDREKNQFETGRQSASPDQRQREIEEALAKLEELARRQQELAEQQRQSPQAYQQRWQQEMLRREAEELRRKMEQLSRSQSQAESRQSQQGQQGQQSQQGQQGQQSQQPDGQAGPLERALERLSQATRDMQNAGSQQSQGNSQGEAEARRAAERLREAREMLSGMRREQAGEQIDELARKSQKLAEDQQAFANKMREAFGVPGQYGQQPRLNPMQPGTTRRQSEQLTADQQKLLQQLTELEEAIHKTSRDMAGSQRSASSKLREALGDLQKQELRLKMKWSLEVTKRGMGSYAMTRQPAVTQGLNDLRDRIREAQGAFQRDQAGSQDKIESALAQAEKLRRQLEQMKNGAAGQDSRSQGKQGKQGGQQQAGQSQAGQNQTGQNPNGRQPGQQAAGQQSGQSPESASGSPDSGGRQGGSPDAIYHGARVPPGALSGPGAEPRPIDPAQAERIMREGLRDLAQIEQMLRGSNREISRDMQDAIRQMQYDTSQLSRNPERVNQLITQLIGGVEQIELRLRRLNEDKQGTSVRSGASQPVPPGYAEAVAEYFRRLSKQK